MNYKERQGYSKLKVSLQDMRALCRQGSFEEIEQPAIVYHMTDRENLQDIINDGKIKTFNDYLCYFFEDTKQIPLYIELSGALHGRMYHSTDGKAKKAKPLVIEDTIILKIVPKRKETMAWYREIIAHTIDKEEYKEIYEITKRMWEEFDKTRICHYQDFAFRNDNIEIIELSEIMDNIPSDIQEILEWKRKQEAEYKKGT